MADATDAAGDADAEGPDAWCYDAVELPKTRRGMRALPARNAPATSIIDPA